MVNAYKISHFDEDMQVHVWATIVSTLSEQIMFDKSKILKKDGTIVGNVSDGRVSVRVLDLDVKRK